MQKKEIKKSQKFPKLHKSMGYTKDLVHTNVFKSTGADDELKAGWGSSGRVAVWRVAPQKWTQQCSTSSSTSSRRDVCGYPHANCWMCHPIHNRKYAKSWVWQLCLTTDFLDLIVLEANCCQMCCQGILFFFWIFLHSFFVLRTFRERRVVLSPIQRFWSFLWPFLIKELLSKSDSQPMRVVGFGLLILSWGFHKLSFGWPYTTPKISTPKPLGGRKLRGGWEFSPRKWFQKSQFQTQTMNLKGCRVFELQKNT